MLKLMDMGNGSGEHFDYEGVKNTLMETIDECNKKALQSFQNGENAISEAMGATSGSALSGAAAATAKNTWGNLHDAYDKFGQYVVDLIDRTMQNANVISNTEESIKQEMEQIANNFQG